MTMIKTETSARYYSMAERQGKFDGTPSKEIIQFLRSHLGPSSRMLDIGCGTAGILAQLPETFSYDGLDISEFAVLDAQKQWARRPDTRFAQSDLKTIPLPDNAFDIVLSFNSLEHMLNPRELLLEIKRVLKPGGYFAVTAPNFELPFQTTQGRRLAPYCLRYKSTSWRFGFMLRRIYRLVLRMFGIEVFELVRNNITDMRGTYNFPDDDLRHLVCSSEVIAYLARGGMPMRHFFSMPVSSLKALIRKVPGLAYIGTPFAAVFQKP